MHPEILAATTQIVTAFLSRNPTPTDQIPSIVKSVYGALSSPLGVPVAHTAVAHEHTKFTDLVGEDFVRCGICGFKGTMIRSHLNKAHGLTVEGYRIQLGLADDHPVVAPSYAAFRSQLAKESGLGTTRKFVVSSQTKPSKRSSKAAEVSAAA